MQQRLQLSVYIKKIGTLKILHQPCVSTFSTRPTLEKTELARERKKEREREREIVEF